MKTKNELGQKIVEKRLSKLFINIIRVGSIVGLFQLWYYLIISLPFDKEPINYWQSMGLLSILFLLKKL